MRIRNVHERVVAAAAEDIEPLMARLGQPDDALYPPLWEPMWFDGPVAVGAAGTHGTISAYDPGRLMEITFPRGIGITGTHTFTVNPLGPRRSRVRHEVDADATLVAWLGWTAVVRAAHDSVLEELLDRLQATTGIPPASPFVPSPYARLLRWFERPRACPVEFTQTNLLADAIPRVDYSDAFAIERRRETPDDPRDWADAIFDDLPPSVAALMGLRERLVGLVGIDRRTPDSFAVYAQDDDEVLLGADAGHLDFRTSVRRQPGRIVLSSVVQLHNRRGRAYFALIRYIHPFVVRAMLNRAASRLARKSNSRTPPPREAIDKRCVVPLPPGQRAVEGFPRFGTHLHHPPPPVPAEPVIEVGGGALTEPIVLPVSDLATLPRRQLKADFHCVAGWSATDLLWEGVPFATFYRTQVEPRLPDRPVSHVIFEGLDGYRSIVLLEDALADDVLMADRLDGKPLDSDHGTPVRLVSPGQYGFVSTKHLCRIEFHSSKPPNPDRWSPLAAHHRARVWQEERHRHLPGRVVRPVYRALIGPIRALSARGSRR